MESLDLHSLILEELSEVLAYTCATPVVDELGSDPAVQRIIAQCPPLPSNDNGGRRVVSRRHENAVLALAKILSQSACSKVRQVLLDRVLGYLDALPGYSYSFSSFGVGGVPTEHWFLESLISRLLACAAQSPELAPVIMEHVWKHFNGLVDIIESADLERTAAFALPALLGSMEALEQTAFRFRMSDVLMADELSARLLTSAVTNGIHQSVSESSTGMAAVRRTVSLYLQRGVGLSGNYVLAQFQLVLRAVLESRLAIQLVESGDLRPEVIDRKDPCQLWDLISQLDIHCRTSDGDAHELQSAYTRILSFSMQTYRDTRVLLLQTPMILGATDLTTRSMVATGMSIMYRSLYVGSLASLLLGHLDPVLLSSILEHIRSDAAQSLSSLTVVCFRVLATISAFFPSSRDAIVSAASSFITNPPECLAEELDDEGRMTEKEEILILPAATTLASCMRIGSSNRQRIVSAIHTLFNALAVNRIGAPAAAVTRRTIRISRNVILALSQLAQLYKDAEVTSLVVSMICAPRFISSPSLVALAIQCAANVATIAQRQVFVDIVGAALKRVTFGKDSDDAANTSAGLTLTTLAWNVAARKDVVEDFFCATLRSFIDSSVATAAAPKFKRRAVTPLSVYLPILHTLVSAEGYAIDMEATAEQISLWRNFWFHMVVRGYLTEKSYVTAFGKIYATLAAKSPILVHPSSVNYLETEIEYNSILQREYSDASLAHLRQALAPIVSAQSQALLRNVSFHQAAFLLSVYNVEIARAASGNCATVLRYFSNSAVTSSSLLPAIESIADLAIAAYVRETTSKRWSIEASLAGNSSPNDDAVAGVQLAAGPALLPAMAQVRELMVASCHHLVLVSKWAQRFVDKIMRTFPQALLDKSVICTLLELVQLVWKSCKAEQDDQFVPVYWFTSQSLGITLQLPDSIAYRKTLYTRFAACAKRWLELVGKAAPMELETLLQVYLSTPCDDDLNYEPHIGHALALEVGNGIKYGVASSVDSSTAVVALPPNSAPFAYRLGLRDYLRGFIGQGTDVQALKKFLSDIYQLAKENPGMPLPQDGPSMREVVDKMHHATHHLVAAPRVDRELARLLVWVPLTLFDEGLMRATSHMWTTLMVERADIEVLIMVELTIAWTWLIQQHQGLFSQRFEPKSPFAAKMAYTPSDKSARSRGYAIISRALAPHMLLIEFIMQRFDSVKHLPHSNFNVINAILRILQVTFDNLQRITTNALARGPLFMLVHLGFKLLKLGFESSPILETKLRDGLYKIAFRWFALSPRWSFSGSKATLAKEIQVLIDVRHTAKGDTPVLCIVPPQAGRWSATSTAPGALPQAASSIASSPGTLGSNALSLTPLNPTTVSPLQAPQILLAPPPNQQPNGSHHHHHPHLPHPHLSQHLHGLNPLHRHKRHSSKPSAAGHLSAAEYSGATSVTSLSEDDNGTGDLILNTPREQLKRRALRNQSLLLLLLENEICRMATWANPTDQKIGYFPDVTRFARNAEMTESGWQNLVVDAWVADPRLAVQLTHRFSHPAVRRELTSLICKFPGELVREPDALPLLIEQLRAGGGPGQQQLPAATASHGHPSLSKSVMRNSGSGDIVVPLGSAGGMFNNLAAPLTFREQKFLMYWSAVPPITSTAYLASAHSRNPLALQYAMRALECFPVDVTFFYIPQLVQALRHDQSGYVERAIISSAKISQHFAHQIIWNMKANMFKDEESLVADSLKPSLDRVVEQIVDGLSGDDRVYYEKEFGFFGEVTGISGKLKPFIKKSKAEKKRKIDEEMRKIQVEPGVYLPSNPDGTVVDIDYDSGRPLQSHAKAPFMATFIISRPQVSADEVQELLKESERTVTPPGRLDDEESVSSAALSTSSVSDVDASNAISISLPVIEETRSLSAQIELAQSDEQPDIVVDDYAEVGASQPLDTGKDIDGEFLASKLTQTKIQAFRSYGSVISDAPDLIGISSRLTETPVSRPSRDATRSRSATAGAMDKSVDPPMRKRNSSSAHLSLARSATDRSKSDSKRQRDLVVYRLSAIFKVGDDCRQDVLALQLIAVFKNIFTSCGLDLYLFPYRVVATAPGCGVIDVIPNSMSRDQMGREKVNSLSDYFATKYHGVDSIQYQQARSNFVQSLAAYSVLSYLLQFKDRHNGNIMIDDQGHIVHIDFGFILDIAPGGITFESAPFKLTTEYIQVMGGSADAQPYKLFCELCIKAYLASRPYAENIIQIVALMLDSGLPCFKGETTLAKLRGRFQLDKTERDAAQFMAERILDSYENKRTVFYDQFQKATNGIPY
ncbi:phosphatidylinositol-4- kinase [Coemansia sp. S16]|nr:phosphatidylinositol-4- kinase [Coemansia sp. S3946]KAJ2047707.1 phosphatidylinositol-4- kinase [Coemansia sp. S16]